jgi:hypothetical protein
MMRSPRLCVVTRPETRNYRDFGSAALRIIPRPKNGPPCGRRCRSGRRWDGVEPLSCVRRPKSPIERVASLGLKEVGSCGVHHARRGAPTRARSVDYTVVRSVTSARLRITMDSASSGVCGAPHTAELESSLISGRVTAGMNAARVRGKRIGRPPVAPPVVTGMEALVATTDLSICQIQREGGGRASRGVVGEITKRARAGQPNAL